MKSFKEFLSEIYDSPLWKDVTPTKKVDPDHIPDPEKAAAEKKRDAEYPGIIAGVIARQKEEQEKIKADLEAGAVRAKNADRARETYRQQLNTPPTNTTSRK